MDKTINKFVNWFGLALIVGLIGGIIGLFISPFIAASGNATGVGAITLLVLIAITAWLAASKSKIAKFNFVSWVLFVATISFWGTVFGLFFPAIGKVLLSAGTSLTWVSFVTTITFALVSERIVSYFYTFKV